jgi:hypothetical protein
VGILVKVPGIPRVTAPFPQAGSQSAFADWMQNTFTHKLLLTIAAGFVAACLLWVLRHFVEQAFYESNEGWRDMYRSTPAKKVR